MHPYAISEGSEDPLAAAGACYRDSVAVCRGIFPNEMDLLANAMVSFACAMQVQAFRKVNGYAFASTMCIGNLRSGMESLCAMGRRRTKKSYGNPAIILESFSCLPLVRRWADI